MKNVPTRAAALLLSAMLAVLPLSSCGQTQTESERFAAFTHDSFVDTVSGSLLDVHYSLRDPAAYGIEDVPKILGRFDTSTIEEDEKELAKTKKELLSFHRNELTPEQQVTYDVLADYLTIQQKFDGLTYYQEPNTITGIQSSLAVLLAEYRFYTLADVDDYLVLLDDVDDYFTDMLAFQKERSAQGLFMADTLADEVIKGLEDFAKEPEDNFLLATFDDRLAAFPELTQSQRDEYSARNRKAVLETVVPAYQSFADGLRALKGTGVGNGSLAKLPKGKEYYEALVAYKTGSPRSVENMSKWLEEVEENLYGDVSAIYLTDPNAGQLGLEALMMEDIAKSEPAAILEDLKAKIAADFEPLSDVQYQLKTVHPSMQESMSPAFYLTPPFDAAAENPIYTNPFYMNDRQNLYLYTTLAHEGFPGHLYENNFFLQTKPDPIRHVIGFSGFSEGWGTYAEMLAYDYAPMEHSAAAKLQRINQELVLLIYCNTDIGVHYLDWDVEKLADFLDEKGFAREAAPDLFQAVTGDPANYLSYGVGYFEFKELRAKAETELGAAFDAPAYHSMLLSTGPSTFGVLAKQVDRFIEETKNPPLSPTLEASQP